ncbi:YesL family protein [Metabacillus sp. RGM 3146]|uniref:YesL family protein n=1 Tax=Metabacillus sp. RGM 3146 TaxID=3401092 RepID=UPI003B9D2383
MTGVYGRLNVIFEMLAKLALLNLLWLVCTLAGGILFGLFPAAAALHEVLARLFRKEEVQIGKAFKNAAVKNFKKANASGYLFTCVLFILYVDYHFFHSFGNIGALVLSYFSLLLFVILFTAFLVLFPLQVRYEGSLLNSLKNSFRITLGYPGLSLLILIGFVLIGTAMFYIPGLMPFYLISGPSYFCHFVCTRKFKKIETSMEG